MRVEHDSEAEALYVTLAEGVVARTIELSGLVNVDVDKNGDPLGVEVLGVSAPGCAPRHRRCEHDPEWPSYQDANGIAEVDHPKAHPL